MKQKLSSYTLADQRGVAMVLELVLVAAVLTLVGLAVYQTNHRGKTAAAPAASTAPNSAQGIANQAAATTIAESANDSAISASADATTNELSATDQDVSNLGASSNASY